ncbi:MAG: TonB-dependent receptor [Saprospiraceae bacterium]|nr:TonB-dependent receptor [Saprospiraceae bacterium]MCF8250157.1 TonB-dependent receptor [Saprospiraceae bacterium]MCF8279420.1 TonB-dependent receptor [Bacteroidales bacterium]MCF8311211.1 TonB-dependent receptor [Saprospiraceae bacterium]MCF8440409.1 TonB-dependent receptor [Saprospiraceae bacterium]
MTHVFKAATLLVFSMLSLSVFAQKFTISGYIEDGGSGEKLIAANAFDLSTASGAVSNTYGFYSLTLPKDSVHLEISYIGYETQSFNLYLDKNITLNFKLNSSIELAVVEVKASRQARIEEETQMSRVDIPIEQIKKIPALLGEVDVLKSLQLLPGVQSGGEGQTGLYVRGGSPDQNLILLDGVPVYNVSHVLGIFSVFNADAIKNVTLTKGGFPARYGGRLSSVLEINMKEGNMQEFHGEGSVGLISSKLTLEGPLWKDKTSFLISGRRTYIDLITRPLIRAAGNAEGVDLKLKLYFYDLNAKINHKFNDKHRLYLSAYSGSDIFSNKFAEDGDSFEGGIDWGNIISAARWNWQIMPKLFANTTLTYSKYQIDILAGVETKEPGQPKEAFSAKYFSGIEDLGAKVDFDFIPSPKHYLRFGAAATHHTYRPGALALKSTFEDSNLDTLIGSQNANSGEYALYVEDDISLGALKANIGLHASGFAVDGRLYKSLQPRIGLRYLLSNDVALKTSFATMTQYINLLTSEALSLPTDLWVPSTEVVKPQQSWQLAVGAAKTLWDEYEFSIEGYYKDLKNVLSFKEGASFLFGLENDWQDKVTQGDGETYGAEFFIQKKKGRTTGWIGYTLSWNWRQFDEVNGGKRFPFRYDRRHDVSVVVSHDFTKRLSGSLAWVYGTGNAVTLEIFSSQQYVRYNDESGQLSWQNNYNVGTNGEKNGFRMSDYHRMDASLEFKKQKKWGQATWVLGVYNAYWNRNPYYLISETEYEYDMNYNVIGQKTVFKEISILPIIPSIAYNFKF